MTKFHIRSAFFGGRILHTVEIAGETPPYAPDLRGVSLENANLAGADLRHANLSGVCLRGARLREAMLEYADLSGVDLSYCDLRGAHFENANLNGTILYPAETLKAKFYGAKFLPDSDAAEYARIACEEMINKMRIHPNSAMYLKLQRIIVGRASAKPKSRHPSGSTKSASLFRGEHMNQMPKIILRVMAVAVGTACFLPTFYVVLNMPELTSVTVVIGWYGTALGQMLIGLILAGIGLGVVSIRFGKEN